MQNLGIIAALKDEVKNILENPFFNWQEIKPNVFHSLQYKLYLVITGVGKANAVYGLSKIIDKVPRIFILGTSGGLNAEKIGALYLSLEFVEHDMDASGLGFPKGVTPFDDIKDVVISNYSRQTVTQIKNICQKLNLALNFGRTISGDQFLANPVLSTQKRTAFEAQLVDMESAAIAKICKKEGKKVLALRYIADNANHDSCISWTENVQTSSEIFNQILEGLCVKS
ncbi:5'-methylthioadenosine/S-adenosylhomocysteine nucleosidase [bacterium]|jgi:adenosylhomocysteine nucleosidase|nr:5'-methylthioadenosine/S-adenosylhomocysteine nucleosidase [bacterium]MBT3582089.1 5'-methylthioadenosine/S-adenosylhomocysteine nucleosidase [bacterium]MBT4552177.1 5'-methylthioadenosine/S-adenosylhomocysteine nucleosidase [bacterium]